jgi:tetratricopeptide (TPR) repeat protein
MKGERMKAMFRPLMIVLLALSTQAFAAGEPGGSSAPEDPVIQKANELNASKDWAASAAMLREALAKSPDNADYHNLYAYALRKGPNPDMDQVFKHYDEALRLQPKSRNAHEYIGEAYLMVGNLPKAKEHLAQLDKLCFFPCSQYSDLKQAVADYESKHKQ